MKVWIRAVQTVTLLGLIAGLESPEATAIRAERTQRDMAEALDRRLTEEGVDKAWADKTAETIRSATAAHLPGTRVSALNCASTLCRITFTHENASELQLVGKEFASLEPFSEGTYYRYDQESSPPRTTLYVMRSGQGIAEMAQNR